MATENPEYTSVYLLNLELENIRCFKEKVAINFADEDGNWKRWNIILGDNGVGKSTLLQSIDVISSLNFYKLENTFTTVHPKAGSEFFFPSGMRKVDLEFIGNEIVLNLVSFEKTTGIRSNFSLVSINGESKILHNNYLYVWKSGLSRSRWTYGTIESSCFGYGATRVMDTSALSGKFPESSLSLFYEDAKLLNAEEWLLQLDYAASKDSEIKQLARSKLQKVEDVLKSILPDVEGIRFPTPDKDNFKPTVEFNTPFGWKQINHLSLGYKTMVVWLVDLTARLFERYPDSENPLAEPAIVLVDEIDLHLHPKWQRRIFSFLAEKFPKTQFIVTAHSPLIVQSVPSDSNLILLRKEGAHVIVDQSIDSVRKWRIDQILSSELFDIPTRNEEVEQQLKRRKDLLLKGELTESERRELEQLNREADLLPQAESKNDIEAKEIIRKAAEYFKQQGIA